MNRLLTDEEMEAELKKNDFHRGQKGYQEITLVIRKAQDKHTREVLAKELEGMENPYNFFDITSSHFEIVSNRQYVAFEECRQRIYFKLTGKAIEVVKG